MLFSAKAEYGCLAMLELAARHDVTQPVRLSEIADKHGIPPRFLVQILLQLKGAGLVVSTRGAAGGYQLAKSPEQITLADILGVIDRTDPNPSGSTRPTARRQEASSFTLVLKGVWDRILKNRQQILEGITLASLCESGLEAQYVI